VLSQRAYAINPDTQTDKLYPLPTFDFLRNGPASFPDILFVSLPTPLGRGIIATNERTQIEVELNMTDAVSL